jgi:hypothetical protein
LDLSLDIDLSARSNVVGMMFCAKLSICTVNNDSIKKTPEMRIFGLMVAI